MKNPEEIFC